MLHNLTTVDFNDISALEIVCSKCRSRINLRLPQHEVPSYLHCGGCGQGQ